MGQCLSSETVGGETEEAYRARWQAGALGQGVNAYDASKFEPKNAGTTHIYTTTADVGMPRTNSQYAFLQDKPSRLNLDPIDENHSLKAAPASPSKPTQLGNGAYPSPRRPPPAAEAVEQTQDHPTNWTRGELIGQGAFGSVYLGMDNDTGQLMAVKQVSFSKGGPVNTNKVAEHIRSLEAEVQLLHQLNHPNIVRYLGTDRTDDSLNIFLEYASGGSIASLLAKFGSFTEQVVRIFTKQILQGLDYLHSNGIIHRDIKGANILIDNTGLVKLADFGASRRIEDLVTLDSGFKSVKGTPYWMAPEVIMQSGHGRQADIWSVACTVIEMATGKPPWTQFGSQVSAMFNIAKSKGPPTIPEHLSPECKDFLYLCFNRNWKERPQAAVLLQHAFLAGIPPRTVAAPFNNIAAAVNIPGVVTEVQQQQLQQQIPAWRVSQGEAPAGIGGEGAAARGASSPERATPRTSMSSPQRQAGLGGGGGVVTQGMSPLGNHLASSRQGGLRTSGASRRQLAVDAEGGFAGAGRRHSAGVRQSPTKRSTVRASAPVFSRATAADESFSAADQRQGPEPPGARNSQMRSSKDKGSAAAAIAPEDTLVLVDPVTLGALRGSGSGSLRRSGSLRASAGTAENQLPAASVPSTVAYSAGNAPPPPSLDASVAPAPASQRKLFQSQTLTPAELRSSVEGSKAPSTERASTSTGPTVSSGTSGASGQSGGFNPMEEPAWMGMGVVESASSPSDDATSIHPMVDRLGSGASVAANEGIGRGRMPAGVVAATAALRQSSARSGGTASEGPIVYTIEAEGDDLQALPWDMAPGSAAASGWAIRSGGNNLPSSARASGTGPVGSATAGPSIAAAAGPNIDQVPSGGVDQDAILEAIRQRAQRDLRASMAIFTAHRSSGSTRSSGVSSSQASSVRSSGSDRSLKKSTSNEAMSPSKQRASIAATRIPRAPESPGRVLLASPREQPTPRERPTPRKTSAPTPGTSAATPSRPPPKTPFRGPGPSPSKRPATVTGPATANGSYEQQLLAQRQARHSTGGGGYGTGSRSAQSSPSKSVANHPLSTPRRDTAVRASGAGGRPASATATVGRTPSRTPAAKTPARRAG